MKYSVNLHRLARVAYGILLGISLAIAVCEIIGGGSGETAFRYQGF